MVFASTLTPQVERDPVGLLLGADHVDVVGDEKLTNSGDGASPRLDKLGLAKIRSPFWFLELFLQTLIFTTANLQHIYEKQK